jgi:hypothetical protein
MSTAYEVSSLVTEASGKDLSWSPCLPMTVPDESITAVATLSTGHPAAVLGLCMA